MKLTLEFDRREAFELDALNAMLHNAGLEGFAVSRYSE